MADMEGEFEDMDTEIEGGADRQSRDKSVSFRVQATRSVQRARKTFAEDGEATPMTNFLVQSALVWAILDLADAVREGEGRPL